ncbi:NAD-dependent epimerase/dehydratase [Rubrobacter xylanophilus DSM 9941]|uniref:NAD-dependent epimerase/dehydratase n=1 Tax=Rubrobacter xylanophilus (strain DSM 9941 / JCM 11954 / NBRC 16129 / PRD-1) TaxID=266117 RepID=Q1AYI6_RUBXD|nr:GDP-mannose 4,6-dehydratase [Rubrobacter xylanophilus]ABG03542.1 NAD-dependent epimerase/dehydratase [Rubrobacter xylanophilus DSM 9941]
MPRALVTGASGFAGGYLVRYLLELGYEVVGAVHGAGARLPDGCHRAVLDITDRQSLREVVAATQPDEIYHLAGIARPANDSVDEFYEVNFGGTLKLLETVREHAPDAAVLLVGSAYAYGSVGHPISEIELFKPVNHYGSSKASADLLGHVYSLEGLRVVRARPFNHSGPGQSPAFVLPTLVEQFVEIEAGKREPVIRLGNLDSVRDFSDVRDIVRGYRLALLKGRSGEPYNLGSGRGTSVRELFEMVREKAEQEVELQVEPSRTRIIDIPYLVADTSKAREELGWEPEVSLEQTLHDMLDAVRKRLVAEDGVCGT